MDYISQLFITASEDNAIAPAIVNNTFNHLIEKGLGYAKALSQRAETLLNTNDALYKKYIVELQTCISNIAHEISGMQLLWDYETLARVVCRSLYFERICVITNDAFTKLDMYFLVNEYWGTKQTPHRLLLLWEMKVDIEANLNATLDKCHSPADLVIQTNDTNVGGGKHPKKNFILIIAQYLLTKRTLENEYQVFASETGIAQDFTNRLRRLRTTDETLNALLKAILAIVTDLLLEEYASGSVSDDACNFYIQKHACLIDNFVNVSGKLRINNPKKTIKTPLAKRIVNEEGKGVLLDDKGEVLETYDIDPTYDERTGYIEIQEAETNILDELEFSELSIPDTKGFIYTQPKPLPQHPPKREYDSPAAREQDHVDLPMSQYQFSTEDAGRLLALLTPMELLRFGSRVVALDEVTKDRSRRNFELFLKTHLSRRRLIKIYSSQQTADR
jgi:hypothetical protein